MLMMLAFSEAFRACGASSTGEPHQQRVHSELAHVCACVRACVCVGEQEGWRSGDWRSHSGRGQPGCGRRPPSPASPIGEREQ